MQFSLSPLAAFDRCDPGAANVLLEAWGHYLGGCRRPFGSQAFVLTVAGEPVSVAVSASTVSRTLAGGELERSDVVELARLCSHPKHRDATRVALRLWRIMAPMCWAAEYWSVRCLVAYSDAARHGGAIYRFDGWERFGTNPGSSGGGTWTKKRERRTPKTLWIYRLAETAPVTE